MVWLAKDYTAAAGEYQIEEGKRTKTEQRRMPINGWLRRYSAPKRWWPAAKGRVRRPSSDREVNLPCTRGATNTPGAERERKPARVGTTVADAGEVPTGCSPTGGEWW